MKPGETLEAAIWVDGRETEGQLAQHKANVLEIMSAEVQAAGYALSPLRWLVKRPGEHRVPDVPEGLEGPDIHLLVAEADVMTMAANNFLADLEPRDLQRLRYLTRHAYQRTWQQWVAEGLAKGPAPILTDRQCDTIISDHGPDAAVAALEIGEATIQ